MALTTDDSLACDCGHIGKIRMRENDTPYSSDNWVHYILIDLNGSGYRSEHPVEWKTVFAYMGPRCPECGTLLTPDNFIG